jgi:hypothetical protein
MSAKVGMIETFLKDPTSKMGKYGMPPDTTHPAAPAPKHTTGGGTKTPTSNPGGAKKPAPTGGPGTGK